MGWSYQSRLTDQMTYDEALDLVGSLVRAAPSAVRSACFFLISIGGFSLHGAPDDASAVFSLYDGKHNSRTRSSRFALQAQLICTGANAEDPRVQNALRAVTEQTGLPFVQSEIYRRPDTRPDPQQRLYLEVAIQEAYIALFHAVGPLLPPWRELLQLVSNQEIAARQRAETQAPRQGDNADRQRSRPPLRFAAEVRRLLRERFPGFSVNNYQETVIAARAATPEWNLTLMFERAREPGFKSVRRDVIVTIDALDPAQISARYGNGNA